MTEKMMEERTGERVYRQLRQLVTSRQARVGDRLASLRSLAQQFGASMPTVQRALNRLEAEGLVDKRRGAGTFVKSVRPPLSMDQSIVLGMEGQGHVWADLTWMLTRSLQTTGRFVSMIDTSISGSDQLIERVGYSEAQCLIVRGQREFPFEALDRPLKRGTPVVAAVKWRPPHPIAGVHQVLSDFVAGGRLVADHLAQAGHRSVLIAGHPTQIEPLLRTDCQPQTTRDRSGVSFVQAWEERGLSWSVLPMHVSGQSSPGLPTFDPERLQRLASTTPPITAVFGLLDVAAYSVARWLQANAPQTLRSLEFVGYYNTPWSQAGLTPISSVDLDLPRLVEALVDLVERLSDDDPPDEPLVKLIPPRLVLRSEDKAPVSRQGLDRNEDTSVAAASDSSEATSQG